MARPSLRPESLRVLVAEGSSTSAREAITLLGRAGHRVEVCDPSPWCLSRFSRFVDEFHRCPGLRGDPDGFLGFVQDLLAARRYDVLLPTHEQGFVFARRREALEPRTGIALPSFDSYRTAHSKAGFSRLLQALGLPQPPTRIVTGADGVRGAVRYPCVIKTATGTASRGVWHVRNPGDLARAIREMDTVDGFSDEVLVQDFAAGATEKAQAVFCHGELLGFHAYRQVAPGAGGGEAIKQSVRRPGARDAVARIGWNLDWHGGLSVDYLADGAAPSFIDCNPRLVEPMSASLAGVDLVALLMAISRGETPQAVPDGREGVRTHLSMQALLGCALNGGHRRDIVVECARLLSHRGPYAGSREELTPARLDWMSVLPLAGLAGGLLAKPALASSLATRGWGDHLLDTASVRTIADERFQARRAQGASSSG